MSFLKSSAFLNLVNIQAIQIIDIIVVALLLLFSPPQFAESLAQLCIMKTGVLVAQTPPGSLSPDHEGVHGTFDMDPLLVQPAIMIFVIRTTKICTYIFKNLLLSKKDFKK